jgi:hypothetical protein
VANLSHFSASAALLASPAFEAFPRLGVGRVIGQLAYGSLPARARDEAIASAATPDDVQSTIEEYIQGSASMDQAASLGDFGDAFGRPDSRQRE